MHGSCEDRLHWSIDCLTAFGVRCGRGRAWQCQSRAIRRIIRNSTTMPASPVAAASARPQTCASPGPRYFASIPTPRKQLDGNRLVQPFQRTMKGASAGQPRRALAVGVVASAAKGGGGEVLVVGSSGQTAARVVVELCKSGYKVTAGALRGISGGWQQQQLYFCFWTP